MPVRRCWRQEAYCLYCMKEAQPLPATIHQDPCLRFACSGSLHKFCDACPSDNPKFPGSYAVPEHPTNHWVKTRQISNLKSWVFLTLLLSNCTRGYGGGLSSNPAVIKATFLENRFFSFRFHCIRPVTWQGSREHDDRDQKGAVTAAVIIFPFLRYC